MSEFLCTADDSGAVSQSLHPCFKRNLPLWQLRNVDTYSDKYGDQFPDRLGHANGYADPDTGA